jgi:hypothetical protein
MSCHWYQLSCKAEEAVSNATDSAVEKFVQALADGCRSGMEFVSTFWMKVPSPTIASADGGWHGSDMLTSLQEYLLPLGGVIAVVTFAVTLLKVAFSPDRADDGFKTIIRQFIVIATSTLPVMAVTALLITFGDLFSPWIMQQASGQPASEGFKRILIGNIFEGSDLKSQAGNIGLGTVGLGLLLVIFLIGTLGALVQCVFMVLRGAALMILIVILPTVGAGSGTEEGWLRYKRLLMIILGFVLYKPTAAVIYAVGLKLMSQQGGDDQVKNAIYGLTILAMAAVALPALIKFLVPAAAAGSSAAFSGGAAVGVAAAGAAVVALAGSGGAAAAGAGKGAGTADGATKTGGSVGQPTGSGTGAGDATGGGTAGGGSTGGGDSVAAGASTNTGADAGSTEGSGADAGAASVGGADGSDGGGDSSPDDAPDLLAPADTTPNPADTSPDGAGGSASSGASTESGGGAAGGTGSPAGDVNADQLDVYPSDPADSPGRSANPSPERVAAGSKAASNAGAGGGARRAQAASEVMKHVSEETKTAGEETAEGAQ